MRILCADRCAVQCGTQSFENCRRGGGLAEEYGDTAGDRIYGTITHAIEVQQRGADFHWIGTGERRHPDTNTPRRGMNDFGLGRVPRVNAAAFAPD